MSDEQEKKRRIQSAAQRALAEAEERRNLAAATDKQRPKEIHGRKGPEPVRYGDWEKDGIASDF
ncbi:MAG: DUF1674 domain-containing protein [Fimbriimonadaceae bacterium]|nr:DUF1674 domain-containing protein [Alphaproteobacteria bacterium]